MKIGIATFHWANNYGAVLQAYSLQLFLLECGHEIQIVDFRPHPSKFWAARWLAKSPRACMRKWEKQRKQFIFEHFRKKKLICTQEIFRSGSDFRKLANRFELLITGSDQVWNPRWLDQGDGLWDFYFLSFAGEMRRRISYAASIGHSELSTLTSEWRQKLGFRMKSIDAISVREQSGVELVRQLSGRTDAVCVPDPTFFMSAEHWNRLAGQRKVKTQTVFSYVLHGLERETVTACQTVAQCLGLKIVKCNLEKTGLHFGYTLPSPEGWLRQIRDAGYVVTNSFHCTVFCLIFHVQFIAVLIDGEIGSMNARITDLLDTVGLRNRIISLGSQISPEQIKAAIDWDDVDKALADAKCRGISFLSDQGLFEDSFPEV